MRWQIMKGGEPTADPIFDDGVQGVGPGEDGFTTDLVKAAAKRLRADGWNYVGPAAPDPQP